MAAQIARVARLGKQGQPRVQIAEGDENTMEGRAKQKCFAPGLNWVLELPPSGSGSRVPSDQSLQRNLTSGTTQSRSLGWVSRSAKS